MSDGRDGKTKFQRCARLLAVTEETTVSNCSWVRLHDIDGKCADNQAKPEDSRAAARPGYLLINICYDSFLVSCLAVSVSRC